MSCQASVWLDACASRHAALARAEPDGVRDFFRAREWTVFRADLPAGERERVLRAALRQPHSVVMVCGPDRRPATRALVVDWGQGVRFLERVAALCRGFPRDPVVLSVAANEERAAERQEVARATLYRHGVDADFDLIAGCELRTAVARAARARGCSHVILEREYGWPWWRRLRGETVLRLAGLADRFTLVALPPSVDPSGGRDLSPCG